MPNQEPAFSWPFGNGPVRVGTQGLFRPCLKTFVAPSNPARLTAPGSPRMLIRERGSFIERLLGLNKICRLLRIFRLFEKKEWFLEVDHLNCPRHFPNKFWTETLLSTSVLWCHLNASVIYLYIYLSFFLKSHSVACQARRGLITGHFFVFFFFHTGRWAYKWGRGEVGGRSYSRKFMVCFLRVLNVRNYVGCCHGNDNDMEILF